MAENEAPERIRLIRDNNGLLRSGWYYPDAAVGPYHSEIQYVRIDLAVPAAAQWSTEFPTIDGWYWVRKKIGDGFAEIVMELQEGGLYHTGCETDSACEYQDAEFLGPIQPTDPDAVRQARRETWEQVGVVLSGFGRNIRKVDLIEALEREHLRAEGEKGEENG